jgi:hypothetical protein
VSESKKNLDPNDPAYYAPPRSRDRTNVPASSDKDRQALSVSRGLDEQLARLRTAKDNSNLPTAQSDVFAEAVARMLREQMNNGLGDAPAVLKMRSSARLAAKLAVAVVRAVLRRRNEHDIGQRDERGADDRDGEFGRKTSGGSHLQDGWRVA